MDYLFPQKNAPLILSRQLRQLIQNIGQTKTKQQQMQIINNQIEFVKEQLQHQVNPTDYPDIIVKLIYFQTLGYNTSFARILPINLCQSQSPYLKKISYLLCAMLVKPGQRIAILMHNTIIKDLESENMFTNLTVLTMLRYFLNEDIARDILSSIRRMLKHKVSMIRRKSLLVYYNISQNFPHLIDDLKEVVVVSLQDQDTPVLFAGLSIIKDLINQDHIPYKQYTGKFVEILDKIIEHKYPPQYDYHKIPAPWMQIDLLKILQKMGKNDMQTSKLMTEVLQKCMRRTQNIYMHFNKGILQQCIKTCANIYPHQFLLSESEKALQVFFSEGNNNNIKSFGLAAMKQLAKVRAEVLTKWQLFLVQCLESQDITLAERTIELLVEIANQENTEVILNRIIGLTEKSTDPVEKRKLIKNSIYLIERFSNQKVIFLRRMNEIFYKFEEFVSDTSINNYLKALNQMVELQPDFIDLLISTYIQIIENFKNSALVKVSVWIIGQMTHQIYLRDKNSEAVDRSVQAILSSANQYIKDINIIFIIVSSLMKLSPVQMTSKHEQIKSFLLKVQSQYNYSIHKCAQQYIRMAKYSKALYGSSNLDFDPKMRFLTAYVDKNYETGQNNFLISKKKSQKSQANQIDLLTNELPKKETVSSNIFEFKPGKRWGNIKQQDEKKTVPQIVKPPRKQSDSKIVLRGPHQEKKTKSAVDEKKMKLAKSIFGKSG